LRAATARSQARHRETQLQAGDRDHALDRRQQRLELGDGDRASRRPGLDVLAVAPRGDGKPVAQPLVGLGSDPLLVAARATSSSAAMSTFTGSTAATVSRSPSTRRLARALSIASSQASVGSARLEGRNRSVRAPGTSRRGKAGRNRGNTSARSTS
jgi:hypothetical protein